MNDFLDLKVTISVRRFLAICAGFFTGLCILMITPWGPTLEATGRIISWVTVFFLVAGFSEYLDKRREFREAMHGLDAHRDFRERMRGLALLQKEITAHHRQRPQP